MKFSRLIHLSQVQLQQKTDEVKNLNPNNVFRLGANWMHKMLGKDPDDFNDRTPYGLYGLLKYGISTILLGGSAFYLFQLNPLLTPLSLLFFFLGEVHFLFLFPLLIEKAEQPIRQSISLTYRMGLIRTTWTLILIATYMMVGLFNLKRPLKNWYVGCMAIINWYKNEVNTN